MGTERDTAIENAGAFIHALDTQLPVLDPRTIELHLDSALGEFSEWRPLRKLASLALTTAEFSYALPLDFMDIDVDSFNHAVNPANLHYHRNGNQFEMGYTQESTSGGRARGLPGSLAPFGITQPPYASSQALSFGISFPPGSRFEFGQLPDGTPAMFASPAPAQAVAALKFMYLARHSIANDSGPDPLAPGFVLGANTVKPEDRGLLWAKVGQLACLSLARSVAANRFAPGALLKVAKECEAYFDKRTREKFEWAG